MATQITGSQLFVELANDTIAKFTGLTNPQKLALLNSALVSTYDQAVIHARSAVEATATLSFTGTTANLPNDFNYSPSNDWHLHDDVSLRNDTIVGGKGVQFDVFGETLRFNQAGAVVNTYYLRYLKEPSQYADIENTIVETKSTRYKEILKREIEHLFEVRRYQGQLSATAQSARFKATELQ